MATTTYGYAVCIHECVQDGCQSSDRSKFWTRYGNPLRKHATSPIRHPNCYRKCPGYAALGQTKGKYVYHVTVTTREMEGAIRRDDAGDNDTMAVDNDDGNDHDD